jgi:renal tumor antigen
VSNLREIQALKRLTPHPNIINLEEVLYDEPSGRLAMVFELMEQNLYDMISGESFLFPPALLFLISYFLRYSFSRKITYICFKKLNVQ